LIDYPPRFEFAPQMVWLPKALRIGLLAHEVGHVLRPGSEQDADDAAEEILGIPIAYDMRWPGKGLQSAMTVRSNPPKRRRRRPPRPGSVPLPREIFVAWAVGPRAEELKPSTRNYTRGWELIDVPIDGLMAQAGWQQIDLDDPRPDRVWWAKWHWSRGLAMDPPLVGLSDQGALVFEDGRHRLAAAWQLGERVAPVFVPAREADGVAALALAQDNPPWRENRARRSLQTAQESLFRGSQIGHRFGMSKVLTVGEDRRSGEDRVWLEGNWLQDLGYDVGKLYDVSYDEKAREVRLALSPRKGKRKVSKHKRGKRQIPVIDLTNKAVTETLLGADSVVIETRAGEIVIRPASVPRMIAERKVNGLEGSVFTGAGFLSEAGSPSRRPPSSTTRWQPSAARSWSSPSCSPAGSLANRSAGGGAASGSIRAPARSSPRSRPRAPPSSRRSACAPRRTTTSSL
jgi:hypothetical protein